MENSHREHKNPLVSIIIPCRNIDDYTRRCLVYCDKLEYRNFEVVLLTDWACAGLPAIKRNFGMSLSKGDFLAFIDSDAYPASDWLTRAVYYLTTFKRYTAVCGPGIIPYDAPLLEKASDLVLKFLPYNYRVTPKNPRLVAEYPTFNLIVRKKNAPQFSPYLTGEDSLFCRQLKGEILYAPDVIVYHNRRPLFKPFINQISTYGRHRGHLIRLAILGWLSVLIFYPINFIKGLFKEKL